MDAMDLINAALAAPKTHATTITYSDGSQHYHEHRSEQVANNHLETYRGQMNRDLISRSTGKTIRLVSREVKAL